MARVPFPPLTFLFLPDTPSPGRQAARIRSLAVRTMFGAERVLCRQNDALARLYDHVRTTEESAGGAR